MEHIGIYPVDTIKTHMQASNSNLSFNQTAKMLYRNEGIGSFFRGAKVLAGGCLPADAAQFLCYELVKEKFDMHNEEFDCRHNMILGAATVLAHDIFIAPSDLIKQRMQLCKNTTTSECFRNVIADGGFKSLMRSFPITVFMNLPFQCTIVCVNENLKTLLLPWERSNPTLWYFLCAGVAGGIAGAITTPIDVVKTRMQLEDFKPVETIGKKSLKGLKSDFTFN
jgi:solute carrier family 25 iron transporter 28/37